MHMRQKQKLFSSYITMIICMWETWANASKLIGLHSGELSFGHLVLPFRVHENGTFLSYNLTNHHAENYYIDEHRRRQRHLTSGGNNNLPLKGVIHYRLNIPNETETLLHLELEPHNYFMAPHLIVERHRRDLRSRRKPAKNNTKCHFHGKIRGQSESKVAISTCAGLVGHIKTKNNEYFIEPSKQHNFITNAGHPHVVFRRPSIKQKRKKHKKSHKTTKNGLHGKHPYRKLSMLSNCGTKEPRRRMETRLEWQSLGKVKIQGGRHIQRNHKHNFLKENEIKQQPHQQPQTKLKYETAGSTTAFETLVTLNNVRRQKSHQDTYNFNNTTVVPPVKYFIAARTEVEDGDIDNTTREYKQYRKKRSISSPRHVETLIVADSTMLAFHEEVETYLLTIMNMVSSLYKDPSIGNSIEIVVVKIILLEEEEAHMDLNLTQNAQHNLNMFCSWQHKLNSGNENDPNHHDVAILVTRKNICGNNCMTLGLANVGGMCKPKQSCSVNEDNGIMLSHTVAHELGHNFGMFHDTAKIGCHPRVGSIVHIMTPTFGADTLQVCWSNCSRKYITHFLDQGLGDCLDDAPTPHYQYDYPVYQPGVIFNAELQCRLQFNLTDGDVGPCSAPNEICSTLWCRVNGECVTNMRPTAPGTSCGRNKWCQNGECVRMRNKTVIDGGWGNWSAWSNCSRSCGGGISIQKRECNNPVPANGGLFCIGERKRYHICSTDPCNAAEPSFRSQQCAKFNNVPYQGHIYKWLPYFDKKNPCKLFCTDEDDTVIANWADVVEDGTPCKLGTNNMCIDGICRIVGCDWILDSDVQDDSCGVCGGKGNKCKTVKEIFDKPFNTTDNYVEIVTIPSKARHIVIKELGNMPHFLSIAKVAISDASTNGFYLNGDNLISMPGEFIIAGAESLYERNDEQEIISIPHPIEHAITLYIIVRGNEPNEGIFYEFTLPALNESSYAVSANYSWQFSDWTACTVTCGGGLQYREVLCYNNNTVLSDDVPCWLRSWEQRPLRQSRSCNEQQCPSHWWAGPWSFCPVNSKDTISVRQRSVMCLDHHEIVVEDAKCLLETRPPDKESCTQYLPDSSQTDENINSNTLFSQVQDL